MNIKKHFPNLSGSKLEKKAEEKKEVGPSFLKRIGRKALPYMAALSTLVGTANEAKSQTKDNNGFYFDNTKKEWIYKTATKNEVTQKKTVKIESSKENINTRGPKIDNFEYYNANEVYKDKDTSTAMQNYNKGSTHFKYHTVREGFKGMNSTFWSQRVAEGLDKKLPLRPRETVKAIQHDMLAITKFSIKEGIEDVRAIFIKKGTVVIFDSNGHITAIKECTNPVLTSHTICPPCPPGSEKIDTYN